MSTSLERFRNPVDGRLRVEGSIANVLPDQNIIGTDGVWLTGDLGLPAHTKIIQDGGFAYPEIGLAAVSSLDAFIVPKGRYTEVLPAIVLQGTANGVDVSSKLAMIGLTAGVLSGLKIPVRLTRRGFLALLGAVGVGGALVSCASPSEPSAPVAPAPAPAPAPVPTRIRTLADCEIVLPKLPDKLVEPISEVEFNKLDNFQQADFLLRGGYVKEWDTKNIKNFTKQAADICKKTIVDAFALLMGEDPDDLPNRFLVAATKDEFKADVKNTVGEGQVTEEKLDEWAEESIGTSVTNHVGKQVSILNLEKFQEQDHVDLLVNQRFDIIVAGIAETTAHELSHVSVTNEHEDKNKDDNDLKEWISTAVGKQVAEVYDTPSGLEIDYRFDSDKEGSFRYMLGQRKYGSGRDPIFNESLREFSQRQFRDRLDKKLGKTLTPFASFYPPYAGYEMIRYLNKSLRIEDAKVTDYLNSYRAKAGNDRMRNVVDLLRFYAKEAKSNGYNVSEPQILLSLIYTENTAQVVYDSEESFKTNKKKAQSAAIVDKLQVDFVCDMKDYIDNGRQLIDEALKEKLDPLPTKSAGGFFGFTLFSRN